MDVKTIAARFKQANVPLDGSDTWKVQAATVIKHSALERLAAGCEIAFDPPQILRAEADEAVIVVTGRMGEKSEWSIGEARVSMMRDTGRKNRWGKPEMEPVEPDAPGNYVVSGKQAAYPYAMAEKRAKDRVIIKLVGLHGVYSSEEVDDFKPGARQDGPPETPPTDDNPFGPPPPKSDYGTVANTLVSTLRMSRSHGELLSWAESNKATIDGLPEGYASDVRRAYQAHRKSLPAPQKEAAE